MKRIALLLVLLASTAYAGVSKVAVIIDPTGSSGQHDVFDATLRPLQNLGVPFDVYNLTNPTWGMAPAAGGLGTADSTWFRQRYSAIVIPYVDGQCNGTPVTSSAWATAFRDSLGHSGVGRSPLSGKWTIPVFVTELCRAVPSTSYANGQLPGGAQDTILFIPGINHTSPSGSVTIASGTTWSNRGRLRGSLSKSTTDTLYQNKATTICTCIPQTWAGTIGRTDAIVSLDSTVIAGCASTDTAVVAWKYTPISGRPGIYYSVIPQATSLQAADGTLLWLQYMFSTTSVVPARKLLLQVIEHDSRAPSVGNTVYNGVLTAEHDTLSLSTVQMNRVIITPESPNEYTTLYDSPVLTRVRADFNSGLARWHPFSYDRPQTFYAPADTANQALLWDKTIATVTAPDSFNFPLRAYDPTRIVASSGICGVWMGPWMANRGVKIIDVTLVAPNNAGWAYQYQPGILGAGNLYSLPGANETRTMWVMPTLAFPHDSSAGKQMGTTNSFLVSMGPAVAGVINDFVLRGEGESMYWHIGGLTGTAHIDPFHQWQWSAFNRYIAHFDRVVGIDRPPFAFQVKNVAFRVNPRN